MTKVEYNLETVLNGIEFLVRSILTKNIFILYHNKTNFFIHLYLYSSDHTLIRPAATNKDGYLKHNSYLKTWISFGMVYKK